MKSKVIKQFLLSLILIFILQAVMLVFLFSSFYKSSVTDIKALGVSNMKSQATMVENYLNEGGDVLWFAAGSVEHMIDNGADSAQLLQYLIEQTADMQKQYDENFTGIYGYINGTYIDGSGWVPPEDYEPTERDWYKEAMEAGGEVVLSAPYIDAQTGETIVSYCQMLSDGESVLALDIILNEVQSITEQMTIGDMGYGFIVDEEGLVISHYDRDEIGKVYSADAEWADIIKRIDAHKENEFEARVNGEPCTLFTDTIAGGWDVVIVVNNALMFSKLRMQILTGILLSLAIFLIIVVFSIFSVRKIASAEKGEQESLERLSRLNMNIIRSLTSTIDAKDRYTSGHSQRVADYALRIAKKMGKTQDEQNLIYSAGMLHDVGKISVPKEVINKPGRLTDEEFDLIKVHPVSGYHILRDIHDDLRIGYAAKYHHERYDGKGYPNGLAGETIPEIARIIAVADAYDAMASDRSYRKALPQDVVRKEIQNGKGSQFDPKLADIMLEIIDEDKAYDLRQKGNMTYNVLIIDDDRITIMHLRYLLTDVEGIKVYDALTEEDVYPILEKNKISLIIMDLVMPGESDGIELYQKICPNHEIPVILMTGERSSKTLERIRNMEIDDYLTKPLNPTITREAVHGILQRYSGGDPPEMKG